MKGTIKDLMTRNVTCIKTDTLFTRACHMFSNLHFHHLPVTNEDGSLIGMFSTTDAIFALNNKLANHKISPEADINELIKVVDVMAKDTLFTLHIDDKLEDAIKMFQRQKIQSILILDNDRIVGILTTNDLLTAFREQN